MKWLVLLFILGCTACATNIAPEVIENPPPAEALKAFAAVELKPLQTAEPPKEGSANARAMVAIQENMDELVSPVVGRWDKATHSQRKLIIEPTILELKFVSGGKRVLAGALAGSSAVRMKVKFIDADSGTVIAHPEFFQRAAAVGGAYSVGATDNSMLRRIAMVLAQYLERNYEQAIGGPTGLEQTKE